jgi:hypothetical protein
MENAVLFSYIPYGTVPYLDAMILILVVYDVNCKCRNLKKAISKKNEKKLIL